MRDVAILGAGELGGSLAHVLARCDIVDAVRLVDERGRIAEGKALDIAQSAPVERFATRLSGAADISSVSGAAIVVIADRADSREWDGDEGLMLLRRASQFAGNAVLLCAGARQRAIVERGVRELNIDRRRLIGSAPEAFVAAVRAIVALEANASVRDVSLTVIGNPPSESVLPWEHATINGFAASDVLEAPARRRVTARLPALWPVGPYALATAATKVIASLAGRSRRTAVCYVAPERANGGKQRTAALPVRLGASGVEMVLMPELNAHDRVVLENALTI